MTDRNSPMFTLFRVITDDLDACSETEQILQWPTIADAWEDIHWWMAWWWVETFVQDPGHKARMQRVLRTVDGFFADLAKLHEAETGKPTHIPGRLKLAMQKRLLHAMYPYVDEIVSEARSADAKRAADNLFKYIGVEQWRTKL